MKKIYFTVGTLVAVAIGIFFALSGGTPQIVPPATTTTSSIHTEVPTAAPISKIVPASAQQTRTTATPKVEASPEAAPTPTPNITLSVEGRSYATFAPAGSTLLDTMRSLASTSDFTFAGHDYPSLGFFVDSIQGKKAENSHNWMLYMNGKLSNTGASQTTLKAGDSVEWKYEKSY